MNDQLPSRQPKRQRGRPRLEPGAARSGKKQRSIRLDDERWAKLQTLGRAWLEQAIDSAPEPAA